MGLMNCKRCGRMFNYVQGEPICENCKKEEEELFQTVKQYIYDNPHAGLNQITKECKVKSSKIQQWVREERLVFDKDSPIQLSCEKCGAPIQTGRLCQNCKNEMAHSLGQTIKKPAPAPAPKPEKPTGHQGMQFIKH